MTHPDDPTRGNATPLDASVRLWPGFGLLGGGIAWLAHLLLVWIIAEFGCLSGLGRTAWLGLATTAWLVILVSAGTFAVAVAATVVAWRGGHAPAQSESPEDSRTDAFLARAGGLTSGLFAGVIAVETIPILFYLRSC